MKHWASNWKASIRPAKQRKYAAEAPLHIKHKLLGAHLSKELRTKHQRRSISIRNGDKIKIARGQFRGKTGKVERVLLRKCRVLIGGIELTKRDGSKVPYPIHPSNCIITELSSDKRRLEQE